MSQYNIFLAFLFLNAIQGWFFYSNFNFILQPYLELPIGQQTQAYVKAVLDH